MLNNSVSSSRLGLPAAQLSPRSPVAVTWGLVATRKRLGTWAATSRNTLTPQQPGLYACPAADREFVRSLYRHHRPHGLRTRRLGPGPVLGPLPDRVDHGEEGAED